MIRDRRVQYILDRLNERSSLTVAEMSAELRISEVTVRKILAAMEQDGLLMRTWGGAVSKSGSLLELTYSEKQSRHLPEKKAIAKAAYDVINDGEAIFIDTGTTTIELAKLISQGTKRNVMICTNAIDIAIEMSKTTDLRVYMFGGHLVNSLHCCVGDMTESQLKTMSFDKGFITGDHFTLERGFSTPDPQVAVMKRVALSSCKIKYMLLDFSKYGNDSLAQIIPSDQINTLITDWHMPDEIAGKFEDRKVSVIRGLPAAEEKK